jgi:tartrate-resistant acid phosphatase type 5
MHRLFLFFITVLFIGCGADSRQGSGKAGVPTTQPATKPTTRPTSMPVVRKWTPMPVSQNEVNIIVIGDWGNNKEAQKKTAATLNSYVDKTGRPFNATLLAGDNWYVRLSGVSDYQWQSLFEDMYDAKKLAMPFYVTLGNHDYEFNKWNIERDYAKKNPDSRWKYPAKWYRVDFPVKPAKPLLSVLMLDSNKPKLSKEEWAEQIRWMDAELSKNDLGEWTAACAHHPIFSNGSHGDNGVLMLEWGKIFKEHKMDFYFCGHDHDLQHLQVKDWPMSFVVAGGGGQGTTDMRRDIRGPFSRKLYGFAHLQFFPQRCDVRFVNGADGKIVHQFIRSASGQVEIVNTTGRDKATTRPLRAIQGL